MTKPFFTLQPARLHLGPAIIADRAPSDRESDEEAPRYVPSLPAWPKAWCMRADATARRADLRIRARGAGGVSVDR